MPLRRPRGTRRQHLAVPHPQPQPNPNLTLSLTLTGLCGQVPGLAAIFPPQCPWLRLTRAGDDPQPLLSGLHCPLGPSLSLCVSFGCCCCSHRVPGPLGSACLEAGRGAGRPGSRRVTSLFQETVAPKVAKVSFQGLRRSEDERGDCRSVSDPASLFLEAGGPWPLGEEVGGRPAGSRPRGGQAPQVVTRCCRPDRSRSRGDASWQAAGP